MTGTALAHVRAREGQATPRRGWTDEDTVHASILDWLRRVLPHAEVHHSPNGGWRREATAKKFKRLGVRAGFPDLIVLPGQGLTIFLEVKAAKGRVSPAQRHFGLSITALGGYVWAVVRSIDDARLVLKAAGVTTRESQP